MRKLSLLKRKEPLNDTQLLMTITIGIFFVMYILAMILLGGGFLHAQQLFDMLNDNASLIIVSCGLTIVMIGGGIDISVGAVTSLTVMSCALYLNSGGSLIASMLIAIGIGLAFGLSYQDSKMIAREEVAAGKEIEVQEETVHLNKKEEK